MTSHTAYILKGVYAALLAHAHQDEHTHINTTSALVQSACINIQHGIAAWIFYSDATLAWVLTIARTNFSIHPSIFLKESPVESFRPVIDT